MEVGIGYYRCQSAVGDLWWIYDTCKLFFGSLCKYCFPFFLLNDILFETEDCIYP